MKRRRIERPFILINMAMSADGKIASADRTVSSFGSPLDHENLLRLRATTDAVMCGARTAETAGVTLGAGGKRYEARRVREGRAPQNLRIVVSGSGSISPDAELFRHHFSPIIVLTTDRIRTKKENRLTKLGAHVERCGAKEIDLRAAMSWLRKKWRVQRLVCEGGGALNDAMIRDDLVDEIHLTICPIIIGGRESPTIADGTGFPTLADCAKFQLKSRRRKGDEMFLVYERGED